MKNSNTTTLNLFTLFFLSTLLLACGNDKAKDTKNKTTQDSVENSEENILEQSNKAMKEKLINSHARVAAKYKNLCPKLLQRQVDSSRISRRSEYMKGNYCDYYIYPQVGEVMTVRPESSKVKVHLIMPVSYDFANGPFTIKESRRHTIRVTYTGIQKKSDDFNYNIEFELQ